MRDNLSLFRAIDVTSTGLTVTEHSAFTFPDTAVIVAIPTVIPFTFPLSTVATFAFDEDHVIVLSVALSGRIVAMRLIVSPMVRVIDVLLREIEDTEIVSNADSSEQAMFKRGNDVETNSPRHKDNFAFIELI